MAPAAPDTNGEDPTECDEAPLGESTQASAPQPPDGETAAPPIAVPVARDAAPGPKRNSGARPKANRASDPARNLTERPPSQPIEELRRMLLRLLEDHDEE